MGAATPSDKTDSQHESTPGMDPNMAGMESTGHNAASTDGASWYVVGGFLAINFFVIGTAGFLKSRNKVKAKMQLLEVK